MKRTFYIKLILILLLFSMNVVSKQINSVDIPGVNYWEAHFPPYGYWYGNGSLPVGLKEYTFNCRSTVVWSGVLSYIPAGSVVTDAKFYITWQGPGASTAQIEFKDFSFGANIGDVYNSIGSSQLWGTRSATNSEYSFNQLTQIVQDIVNGQILSAKIGIKNQDESSYDKYVYYDYQVNLRVSYIDANLTVTQLDNQNDPFGQVGIWEDDDWVWNDVPINGTAVAGSFIPLKSAVGFKEYTHEKYWKWTHNSDDLIPNHNNFVVAEDENLITAKFKIAHEGIWLKNNLLEAPGLNPEDDQISFKDPWFIDYEDSQFPDPQGGYYRKNRGMDAIWRSRISPFNPNYINNYEYNQSYQGIFLDQGFPSWTPPYYTVKSEPHYATFYNTGNSAGRLYKLYFRSWEYDPNKIDLQFNSYQTPIVFKSSDAILTANLKGTQLSNELTAYDYNSQRKFVRTDNGNLHNVYISLGALWYERSTDAGQSWYIEGGNPINTNNPKGVSIAHLPGSSGDDYVVIAYQCTSATGSEVWIELFKNGVRPYGSGFRRKVVSFTHSPGQYDGINAEPVVVLNQGTTYKDFMVVFKVPINLPMNGDDPTNSGLYRCFGRLNPTIYYQMEWYNTDIKIPAHVLIPTTGMSSLHPTFAGELVSQSNYFHLAYQENNQIKYYYMYGQTGTGSLSTGGNPYVCSNNTGFSQHYNPSIISMGTTARVCWVGYRMVYYEEENEVDAFPQYRVLFRRPGQTTFWQFGNNVSSPNINKNSTNTYYAFAWSENNSQVWFADNTLSTVRLIGDVSGQQQQISNGTDKNNMYCMAYEHSLGAPFYFERSNNLGSYYQSHKVTNNFFSSGREGVVSVDSAEFYFALGDVEVDGQTINFIEIPDTVEVNNLNSINQCLITEPITLSDNSSFIYSVQYGLNDSLSAVQAITGERFINFKVMIVDDASGQTIGEYDNVTYTQNNLYQYNNVSYQVNTQGIGNRTARLKLVLDNNFESEYSLSRIFADGSVLSKSTVKQISYSGSEVIKSYELSQNYPNPFNPTTTINFQIPKAGNVTLKIYDILGNEVATLVDEFKEVGKFEVNFDASSLASGVYIYRISVNDFVNTKKMVLLK